MRIYCVPTFGISLSLWYWSGIITLETGQNSPSCLADLWRDLGGGQVDSPSWVIKSSVSVMIIDLENGKDDNNFNKSKVASVRRESKAKNWSKTGPTLWNTKTQTGCKGSMCGQSSRLPFGSTGAGGGWFTFIGCCVVMLRLWWQRSLCYINTITWQ